MLCLVKRRALSRNVMTAIAVTVVVLTVLLALTACGGSNQGSGQKVDSKRQQDNYNRLVGLEPAHQMDTSPTRRTINYWIDTWGKDPNKLAYVYMQNANGQLIGYYVFKGLPVSYCTSLTPNYKLVDSGGSSDNGNILVPAPAMDGVYYSGSECNTYYGRDATTGSYIEYTAGLGINVLIYDQPLTNHPNVPNLAPGK